MKRVVKREAPAALEVLQAMGLAKKSNAQFNLSRLKSGLAKPEESQHKAKKKTQAAGRHKKSA
jgi:hypothetical protein